MCFTVSSTTLGSQGRVVAVIGATANTGSVQWVVPRYVQEGVYYFVIRPLHGQRLVEVRQLL